MGLIDADDFLDLFYVVSAGQDKAFIKAVEMVVEDTPAVDAEPVRHGKWMKIQRPGSRCWCSECKSAAPFGVEHNYCPNCGAKMDVPEGE